MVQESRTPSTIEIGALLYMHLCVACTLVAALDVALEDVFGSIFPKVGVDPFRKFVTFAGVIGPFLVYPIVALVFKKQYTWYTVCTLILVMHHMLFLMLTFLLYAD